MTSSGIIYRCRGCGSTHRTSFTRDDPCPSYSTVDKNEAIALVLAGWTIKDTLCHECVSGKIVSEV